MSDLVTYLYGFVYSKDYIYVAALDKEFADENPDHALILRFHGSELIHFPVEAESVSLAYFDRPGVGRTGIVICTDGSAKVFDPTSVWWETIHIGTEAPNADRSLLASRVIDGGLYVTGMLRQVFKRDITSGTWSRIDNGLLPLPGESLSVGFEDIDGFCKNEIYAVGLGGEIWSYDGFIWTKQNSPTNVNLSAVKCANDGKVYVVGDKGTILYGRGNSWNLLEQGLTEENLTSVEFAFGSVFFTENGAAIYRYRDTTFEKLKLIEKKNITTYSLHYADGLLLSVGEEDVATFDGNQWTRLEDP